MPRQETQPDPNFESGLRQSRVSTAGWDTDFSRHSVPYAEIFSGGVPRDGIPPIDSPNFVTVDAAGAWLESREPVVIFSVDDKPRAYPLQILTYHEIVNDVVAGEPVSVTFCPLCNSAIVFDRRLDGEVYDFGVSGMLRNSDLIMWDRQTQSWWQQLTGEAIVGALTGSQLHTLPSAIVSWQEFKTANPDGLVLSKDTGHSRDYGRNPYVGYDRLGNTPFLFRGTLDDRLPPMERVVGVTIDGESIAFPYAELERERVAHSTAGGQDLVVFFQPGTRSALDDERIRRSRDVGSSGVFDPSVDGRKLTFSTASGEIVDAETGSTWTILGESAAGPLAGSKLTSITHADPFWFAWRAFRPDTSIYNGHA